MSHLNPPKYSQTESALNHGDGAAGLIAGFEGAGENVDPNIAIDSANQRLVEAIEHVPPYMTSTDLYMAKKPLERTSYVVRRHEFQDPSGYKVELGFEISPYDHSDDELQRASELMVRAGKKHERIILNALFHQKRAAAIFSLPQEFLRRTARKNYFQSGVALVESENDPVYMQALDRHIDFLETDGATEVDIAAELSGHFFHEAVHEIEGNEQALDILLGGRAPIGEITPITAQLAYYVAIDYFGPRSYDDYARERGEELASQGNALRRNHNIATYVGYKVLGERLQQAFPEVALSGTGLAKIIQELRSQITPKDYPKMIDALKAAIKDSANPGAVDRIIAPTKMVAAIVA